MKKNSPRILWIFYLSLLVSAIPAVSLSAEIEPLVDSLRPELEYKAGDLRDPFLAPKIEAESEEILEKPKVVNSVEVKAEPLPKLVVQGLIWGGSFPQAIINSRVVKAGDEIEGAQIQSISKEGVVISFAGTTYNLNSPASSPLTLAVESEEEDIFNREFPGGYDEEDF